MGKRQLTHLWRRKPRETAEEAAISAMENGICSLDYLKPSEIEIECVEEPMREIINSLTELKLSTLKCRDNANLGEYPKYAEVYEAILEAEKTARRNFEMED